MARKPSAENRDVLKIKFDALQGYLSHHERKLDQLRIDVEKASILSGPGDGLGLLDRILTAVSELHLADPPASLIEADLAEARARVEAEYRTSPEWAEGKQRLIEAGFNRAAVEAGFGPMLGEVSGHCLRAIQDLREKTAPTGLSESLAVRLGELVRSATNPMALNLLPARQLRERWLDQLNGRAPGSGRKPGRPKNPETLRRDRQMFEAWETGKYRTWGDLGNAFGVSADVARKAVLRERDRRKRGRNR